MVPTAGTHMKSRPFYKGPSSTGQTEESRDSSSKPTKSNRKENKISSSWKNQNTITAQTTYQESEHNSYRETKLMLSGDIETQPGPQKPPTFKIAAILLLTSLLILIIGISNYNAKITENLPKLPKSSMKGSYQLTACHLLTLSNKKKQRNIKIQTRAAYLVIILLTAGDIQPHPGPKQEHCLICKQPDNHTHLLTCDTCGGWCHTSCKANKNNQSSIGEMSFQWQCPNPRCLPNHHEPSENTLNWTPSRYYILSSTSENINKRKRKTKKTNKEQTKTRKNKAETPPTEDKERKQLLSQLPKISSKEYIGKDICKICNKSVAENHRAISCDNCERWLHISCTDMEKRTYNMLRDKRKFSWICHQCRDTEILTSTKVDINLLKPEECPTTTQELSDSTEPLILSMNCRSIMNKVDEIKEICYSLKPMILCLTETWMDHTVPKNYIVPEGYSIIRKDRTENFKQRYGKSNGGGVAILYKNNVKIKIKNIADKDDEILWIEVTNKRTFLLGVVYRAAYTDLLTEEEGNTKLYKTLETANLMTNNIILLGDINCDTNSNDPDKNTRKLVDVCATFQMTQLINKPTRITDNTKTTIDHIWTDVHQELIKETGTFIGVGDHLGTYAKLHQTLNREQEKPKIRRNWRNYNESEFTDTLSTIINEANITEMVNQKDLNGSLNALTRAIQQALNKHAPLQERKVKPRKEQTIPWFDKEISEKKIEKNNLLKLYYLLGDPTDKANARKLNNEITHLKEKKKKVYYTNKLNEIEGDAKQTWSILRELTDGYSDRKDTEPENMDQEKANQYNKYFATVGSNIQKKLDIKDQRVEKNNNGYTFIKETEENILKLIDRIKTDVAVGVDGINAKVLKDGKEIIAPILTQIINIGYEINQFPDSLKIASIKPIHKKNCQNDPSNYRPISLLPIISKVFERSAVDQLVKYLENNILSANQHAYRRFHSTVTSLAELTNKIYSSLDEGQIVGLASMDLSKAFDSICHSHLLQKLSEMGLHGNTVSWIESYLQGRKQKTAFKHVTSEENEVTSGVPQGSILGPILFLCFTNDLTAAFPEDTLVSYADDTQFLVTGKTTQQIKSKLERIIQKAEEWYKANSLMSNPSKTEIIVFTFNKHKNKDIPAITVYENGKEIKLEAKETIKVLGVHVDNKMTWNNHVTNLKNKTMGIVKHLHRVNKLLPLKIKLQLYDSLVASHLNYADTIWSGCGSANKQKLQLVQNFALKSILGMKKFESGTEALKKLKYLNLEEKRKVHEGVFIHKAINEKMPKNITEEYRKLQSYGSNRSAMNGNLKIPKHKTSKYENCILYRTIKTWNKTDVTYRTDSTETLKKKLQASYTFDKYQTTPSEKIPGPLKLNSKKKLKT